VYLPMTFAVTLLLADFKVVFRRGVNVGDQQS
jgi:hypothetical protein